MAYPVDRHGLVFQNSFQNAQNTTLQKKIGRGNLAVYFFLSFYHIFTHIYAVVLICIPKCSPFNLVSNVKSYLTMHVFVYELQGEIYRI